MKFFSPQRHRGLTEIHREEKRSIKTRSSLSFLCVPLCCLCVSVVNILSLSAQPKPKPQPKPAQITYTDIAPKSNFTYRTNNNYVGKKYFPQPMCGGIAILDYNNDGWMDIFFTNGAKLPELKKTDAAFDHCLLKNTGDGTFEDVTKAANLLGRELSFAFGTAAGDYDNDGFTDLFIATATRNALYHNNGNGTFADVTSSSGLDNKVADLLSVGGAWFDYDNDGLLDLVVANYTFWNPAKDPRCMAGETEVYCHPRTVKPVPPQLYKNLGDGKFAEVTDKAGFASSAGKGMGISIADFNNDGWQDVFIANDTERNFLFMNQKDGTFKEVGLLFGVAYNDQVQVVSAMGCDAKDFDNDGFIDVFYNDIAGQIFGLFKNDGGKFFSYVSPTYNIEKISRPYTGWSAGFIDYNNDGWKDFYSANGDLEPSQPNAKQHDSMFENVEGKSFIDVSSKLGEAFMSLGYQRGSAFADLNNDGFQDIVITSLDQKPKILMNSANNQSHWLLLKLIGKKSNRDAIGAMVKVTTASGRTLYNHVTTSVGFMSSSDARVHFGLGHEKAIKSIEITWSNGRRQTLSNVVVDKLMTIEEP
jgi:enediyne biosynthesis protein E4